MYDFILGQWIMRVYTVERVQKCVTKNYITQAQADAILATQQVTV